MHHPLGLHAVFIKSFCSHRGGESLPHNRACFCKLMLCGRKPHAFWGESMQNDIHVPLGWVWLSWFPCARLGLRVVCPTHGVPRPGLTVVTTTPCEETGLPHSPVLCGTPQPHRATAARHTNRDDLPTQALQSPPALLSQHAGPIHSALPLSALPLSCLHSLLSSR